MSSFYNKKTIILQQDKNKQDLMKKYFRKTDPSYQILLLKYIELDIEEFELVCELKDSDWDKYEMIRYNDNNMKRKDFKEQGLKIPFYLYKLMKKIDEEEENDDEE